MFLFLLGPLSAAQRRRARCCGWHAEAAAAFLLFTCGARRAKEPPPANTFGLLADGHVAKRGRGRKPRPALQSYDEGRFVFRRIVITSKVDSAVHSRWTVFSKADFEASHDARLVLDRSRWDSRRWRFKYVQIRTDKLLALTNSNHRKI